MKKVTMSLEDKNEVIKMVLDIFKGKIGAQNVVNIIKGLTGKEFSIYDKAFDKEIRKLKPEWFTEAGKDKNE